MKRILLAGAALLAVTLPVLAYVEYPTASGPVGANVAMSLDSTGKAQPSGMARAAATATVSNSTYSIGNAIGAVEQFTSMPPAGWVSKFVATMPDQQLATFDVLLFNAAPTTTVVDNTTLVLNDADRAKWIGVVHVSDCASYTAPTLCMGNSNQTYVLPTGTTIYAIMVARSAVAPTPSGLTWNLALETAR